MKKGIMAKILTSLLLLSVTFSIFATNGLHVKAAEVTDEQVADIKARNEKYRYELGIPNGWACEASASTFGLLDVDNDGIEELIVNDTAICSWKDGKYLVGYESWLITKLYYSPQTKNIMVMTGNIVPVITSEEEINPEHDAGLIVIGRFNENVEFGFETLETFNGFSRERYIHDNQYYDYEKEKYIRNDVPYTAEETAAANATIEKLMPSEVFIECPYAVTDENLDKYLPLDEMKIRELLEAKGNNQETIEKPEVPNQNNNEETIEKPEVPNQNNNEENKVVGVETQEKKINTVISSNTDSSISLSDLNGILPEGTIFVSKAISEGEDYNNARKLVQKKVTSFKKIAVYELDLADSSGVELNQLAGKIQVIMNLPFTLETGQKLRVFRVDGDKLVECTSSVSNGKVTFETDHFSTYVFVAETVNTSPKTGDNTPIGMYIAIMLVSGCGVVLLIRKGFRV